MPATLVPVPGVPTHSPIDPALDELHLRDLRAILGAEGDDVGAVYDRVADRYDAFRELWLRRAGREAEAALLADARAFLHSGARVLDAGAGTGAIARRLVAQEPGIVPTLIDLSPAMLDHAGDVPGEHLVGSILDLPFGDESFDLVVSGWVIETVDDPRRAVTEMLRVLRPEGLVLYTFCSLPDGWLSRAGSVLLRAAVTRGFAGSFLDEDEHPWHDCGRSHLRRFRGGLTTEIALAKCCTVARDVLPAPDQSRSTT